eukprot:Transcript_28499.p4 GENE.Transcript_28499~~Transcript_28499.p4  ORF type:complete len:244 (-),score=83.77 Transcript_28499:62-793(-)
MGEAASGASGNALAAGAQGQEEAARAPPPAEGGGGGGGSGGGSGFGAPSPSVAHLPPPYHGGAAEYGGQAAAAAAAMRVAGDVAALQAAGPAPSPLLLPTHRRGAQPSTGAGRAAAVVGSLLPTWREAAAPPRTRHEDDAASSAEIASGREAPSAGLYGAPHMGRVRAAPAIDCMLRESALDRGTPWVASLRAHRSYWGSKDVMLFVLTRLIYGGGEAAAGVAAAAAPEPAAAPNGPVGVYDV